jgi:hypothetical protein
MKKWGYELDSPVRALRRHNALQTSKKIPLKTLLSYTQDYYHKLKIIEGTVVVSESIPTRDRI